MWSMRTNLRTFEGLSWFCRSDVCDNFPCSTEEKIKFGEDKLWTIDEPIAMHIPVQLIFVRLNLP